MTRRGRRRRLPGQHRTVAIKIKIPKLGKKGKGGRLADPVVRAALALFAVLSVAVIGVFSYYYVQYDRMIEQKFASPVFSNAARIYAAPPVIHPGEKITASDIAGLLRSAGYTDKKGAAIGSFELLRDGIEIAPGPDSYHAPEA